MRSTLACTAALASAGLLLLAGCGPETGDNADAGSLVVGELGFPVNGAIEATTSVTDGGAPDYAKMFVDLTDFPLTCSNVSAIPPAGTHLLMFEWSGTDALPTPGHYELYPNGEACAAGGSPCNPSGKKLEVKWSQLLADGGTSSLFAGSASADVVKIGDGGFVGTFTASFVLGDAGTSVLTGSANAPACGDPF